MHAPSESLTRNQTYTARLQDEVIVHVQAHTVRPAYRTFFINLDALAALRAELDAKYGNATKRPFFAMNIEAFSPTPGVAFDTDNLHYVSLEQLLDGSATSVFYPNTTTLVDIRLRPTVGDDIFRFYDASPESAATKG